MRKQGLTLDEALEYVKHRRSIAHPNEAFMAQLRRYDDQLAQYRDVTRARHDETQQESVPRQRNTGIIGPASARRPEQQIGPSLPAHLIGERAQESVFELSQTRTAIGPTLPEGFRRAPEATNGGAQEVECIAVCLHPQAGPGKRSDEDKVATESDMRSIVGEDVVPPELEKVRQKNKGRSGSAQTHVDDAPSAKRNRISPVEDL
jgi:hypothetical protein